jgi:uncharacterized protein (TIGR00730 family)
VLPGGFGTMDELFEALTLIQTHKNAHFPIILVGSEYWNGLVDWIKQTLIEDGQYVSPDDINLFQVVDTSDEAVHLINEFYSKYLLKPNF